MRSEMVKKYYKKVIVIIVAGLLGYFGVNLTDQELAAVSTLADTFLNSL